MTLTGLGERPHPATPQVDLDPYLADIVNLGTTGAVTRMVDRLERAGYVRRQADPRDRRRVIIRPVPERLAAIAPHYQGMATAWTDLLAAYSDAQLTLFLDLFDRMHQMSQQQLAGLNQDTDTATS